ncbi:Scr1 family TA system antitoxin-like transcriptional regulator [Lentzea sp. JNUCC 0626]|uniref:Scr1 family TA system antitoxin-like transcriptional regulator n=1 Tax=Lentzea sp. JNUCC 0626 TaxID=3367513 RepID=UPI0037496563
MRLSCCAWSRQVRSRGVAAGSAARCRGVSGDGSPFTLLSFSHCQHDDVAYLKTFVQGEYVEDLRLIEQYGQRFEELRALALGSSESQENHRRGCGCRSPATVSGLGVVSECACRTTSRPGRGRGRLYPAPVDGAEYSAA